MEDTSFRFTDLPTHRSSKKRPAQWGELSRLQTGPREASAFQGSLEEARIAGDYRGPFVPQEEVGDRGKSRYVK